MKNKKSVWMRIPIAIVSGAILHVWGCFVLIFCLVQMILLLTNHKKEKEFSDISLMFSNQVNIFFKYVSFNSEDKPFPWGKLKRK
jgi:hypothetical protein